MPDWDEDSPRLRQNLKQVLTAIRAQAAARGKLRLTDAKTWHRVMMAGLTPPDKTMVGRFRGTDPLTSVEILVGSYPGVAAAEVAAQTTQFETTLGQITQHLDATIAPGATLTPDQLTAIIEACAWVHAEWVRIHPFANGNGRTARFWANAIAMRYQLPPFIRLRPRPNFGYDIASGETMLGHRKPTIVTFRRMLDAFLEG
ncbi:Fic family protein [Synoicihabitans lomoniglobus]|uniref:Fic family protein n=1 Tax=Synoicihabitans lomoniglobus TaxID=2909285 RepID=A0AAE9ZXS3_9BACT|nr:Fic family protein [Opitutaceae bacterium LMO-M01]WED65099.1 Fic family protein [Opitutaceae bacterium LMO-M01]